MLLAGGVRPTLAAGTTQNPDLPELYLHGLAGGDFELASPFASVRPRTGAAKRFKKVPNATVLIWKVLMIAERRFRRLDAPELLADVYHGRVFADGVAVLKSVRSAASAI